MVGEASGAASPLADTVIVVAGGTVSMEPCGEPDRTRIKRTRRGMVLKASWRRQCNQDIGKTKLRMRTDADCQKARGTLVTQTPRSRVRFETSHRCEVAILCTPQTIPVDTQWGWLRKFLPSLPGAPMPTRVWSCRYRRGWLP